MNAKPTLTIGKHTASDIRQMLSLTSLGKKERARLERELARRARAAIKDKGAA